MGVKHQNTFGFFVIKNDAEMVLISELFSSILRRSPSVIIPTIVLESSTAVAPSLFEDISKMILSNLSSIETLASTAIIFSSDVEEIHGLSDRFMVLNRGTIKSVFDQTAQVEQLMSAAGENINNTIN